MSLPTNSFSAAPSALGYLFQCRYALLLLLQRFRRNPSVEMAIEKFDDISFETSGTPWELIQTKHHATASNLSDASSDLWKTLRVWAEGVSLGTLSPNNVLFTLVTTATAPVGSIASLLGRGDRDPAEALNRLLQIAYSSENEENKTAYLQFLALSDSEQKDLIESIHILDNEPNIQDVKEAIKSELTFTTEHVDHMLTSVEGWWLNEVIEHLGNSMTDPLLGSSLQAYIIGVQNVLKNDNLPSDHCFIPIPTPDPHGDSRTFVRQLKVINCSPKTITIAICNHYKIGWQRSEWVREHLLPEATLKAFDARLKNEWDREFGRMEEDIPENPTADEEARYGRNLYHKLQEAEINIPGRGEHHDPLVARGSYQILANDRQVWWHPRFEEMIPDEE